MKRRLVGIWAAVSITASMMVMSNAQSPASNDLTAIAERAYMYAYPLVLMEATGAAMPLNRLTHIRAFPDASFRLIVRPNADTLYSTAWLDVSKEPMLLEVPDSGGRFYLLQFMDAWTETFADPGKRTTGTGKECFAVVGPGWSGALPSGVVRLDAATNHVWLLGRTQTNGASDYDNVHAFQNGMRLVPLSQYSGGAPPPEPPPAAVRHASSGASPVGAVKAMAPTAFFATFAQELKADPPHAADQKMIGDFARIGVVPGEDFDPSKLTPEQLAAIDEGARAAAARIEQFVAGAGTKKPGWTSFQGVLGRYGTNYVARAVTARIAIGANPPEDAVYMSSEADSSGGSLSGSSGYRMHFDASELPPVRAFWSVTAYDESGYFIPNPIDRYAIGDRDKLKFNPDGSLDLYIQSEDPGADRESNWLPSGAGPFNLTIRLYWPKDAILNGTWQPPALVRVP
jgi:hypothetical protein